MNENDRRRHYGAVPWAPMAVKKKADTFREMVAIRVLKEDAERLDALAERLPVASRHAIARECLRIGMKALEKDPTLLVRGSADVGRTRRTARGRSN